VGSESAQPPREARRRTSAGPRFHAPIRAALAPDLPDFAKKADDLEAIKKAVDDAASVGGGLWLSYLFVLFYLAVAAGAVTHCRSFSRKARETAVPRYRVTARRLFRSLRYFS
jgi:hypothetical protein